MYSGKQRRLVLIWSRAFITNFFYVSKMNLHLLENFKWMCVHSFDIVPLITKQLGPVCCIRPCICQWPPASSHDWHTITIAILFEGVLSIFWICFKNYIVPKRVNSNSATK